MVSLMNNEFIDLEEFKDLEDLLVELLEMGDKKNKEVENAKYTN